MLSTSSMNPETKAHIVVVGEASAPIHAGSIAPLAQAAAFLLPQLGTALGAFAAQGPGRATTPPLGAHLESHLQNAWQGYVWVFHAYACSRTSPSDHRQHAY